MLKSTAMLLQEYSSYANPAAKIGRIVKKGELVPVVRGLYETDPTTPGYCLSGALYGSAQLSFEYALGRRGFIPEEVRVYTCAVCGTGKRKRYSTPFGVFTYRDVPTRVFPYGVELLDERGYGHMLATPERASCDLLYTRAPCANRRELRELLFDNLRIDEDEFRAANLDEMTELAELYRTTNCRLLASLIKEMKRHERSR